MKMARPAILSFLCFTILLGVVYPLLVYGIAQLFFHHHAEGSLLKRANGSIIGSHWIGQDFQKPEYFHPRPSSAHYNAAHSQGSNLGPTSQKLIDVLKVRAEQYRLENKLPADAEIPADAVTASASGLDPHISIENAMLQAPRVAAARNMSVDAVKKVIESQAEEPFLGLFGTARVNVLRLNMAL